jgi:membrane-bound lytic murein transglycosylase D
VPVADSRPAAADAVVPAVATSASSDTELVKTSYRIKRGDTLASIARAFNTTVAAVQRWNSIAGTAIRAGERLTIYTARAN